MVSPLVLVHPSEKDVKQVNEKVLFEGKLFFEILQLSNYLVRNVDNIYGSMRLPVCFFVSSLDEESDVVHEAEKNFLLLLCSLHHSQEVTRHILAALGSFTELKLSAVVDIFVGDSFL